MFEILLIITVILLVIFLIFAILHIFALKDEMASIVYSKRSQSVKYGQLTEQWIPFSKEFPFDSQQFRFIGKPIDGIVFDDEKVVFVEFKTNKSSLNDAQKKVKKLIEEKKVDWFELRIK
jgi:predicted Holliday junction resolvase-like endonuclease